MLKVIYSVKLFSASFFGSLPNCIFFVLFLFLPLTFVFTVNTRADPAIPERGGLYTAGILFQLKVLRAILPINFYLRYLVTRMIMLMSLR